MSKNYNTAIKIEDSEFDLIKYKSSTKLTPIITYKRSKNNSIAPIINKQWNSNLNSCLDEIDSFLHEPKDSFKSISNLKEKNSKIKDESFSSSEELDSAYDESIVFLLFYFLIFYLYFRIMQKKSTIWCKWVKIVDLMMKSTI